MPGIRKRVLRSLRPRRPGVALATLVLLAGCATTALAQKKPLTLDDIFAPGTSVRFGGSPQTGLVWMDETHYLWPRDNGGTTWSKVDAASGTAEPLFDPDRLAAALGALPGITKDEAGRIARRRAVTFNAKYTALVTTVADDLYLYDIESNTAKRLTRTPGAEEEATFSPDGRLVAFVREANLYSVDVASGGERALTADRAGTLLNGKLDWIYQEEVYGRGTFRAYWWSPDASQIAFLQLDERPVPKYVTVDDIPYQPDVETWDYPKAGDPNPTVKLGIVGSAGGPVRWVDTGKYSSIEFLIVNVAWTPSGLAVAYQVQDRRQSWLDLNLADRATGASSTILRESSKHWVDENGSPTWLNDGSFLWLSERSGWRHVYHYKTDGSLIGQITQGRWEVRSLHGVDQAGGWIYYSGTEHSPIGRDVYRVRLDGPGQQRLSVTPGTHSARFNPQFTMYLDSWSDATTPPQIRLHRGDGSLVRVADANAVSALSEYRLAAPEFMQVRTRDGFLMEAVMIKPPDFNPARKYPVYQFAYGGPHAQQVLNAWGGTEYMFHQLLAQRGIIVWICDNRTASGKGAESTWPVFQRFGESELRDIEDGLAWLGKQPYVDASRIGIHGWSYGGFLTAYALTHSTSFVMGIAGGTVSDWRNYDSIYTERYMGLPQDNPDGYQKSAPRFAAKDLHGQLLLVHGAIDENVHPQNTLQFAYELQRAGKPFQMMIYPKSRHGITDPQLVRHLRGMMFEFIVAALGPENTAGTQASR